MKSFIVLYSLVDSVGWWTFLSIFVVPIFFWYHNAISGTYFLNLNLVPVAETYGNGDASMFRKETERGLARHQSSAGLEGSVGGPAKWGLFPLQQGKERKLKAD